MRRYLTLKFTHFGGLDNLWNHLFLLVPHSAVMQLLQIDYPQRKFIATSPFLGKKPDHGSCLWNFDCFKGNRSLTFEVYLNIKILSLLRSSIARGEPGSRHIQNGFDLGSGDNQNNINFKLKNTNYLR